MEPVTIQAAVLLFFSTGCVWFNHRKPFIGKVRLLLVLVVLVGVLPLSIPLSRLSIFMTHYLSNLMQAGGPDLLPLAPTLILPFPVYVVTCILGGLVFALGRGKKSDSKVESARKRTWKAIVIGGTVVLLLLSTVVVFSPHRLPVESLTATTLQQVNYLEKVLLAIRAIADVIGGVTKVIGYSLFLVSYLLLNALYWMVLQEHILQAMDTNRWLKVAVGTVVMIPLLYEPLYFNGDVTLIAVGVILLLLQLSLLHLNLVSVRWARAFWIIPLLYFAIKSLLFVESLSYSEVIALVMQQ